MIVRRARTDDAEAVADVLRRSIAELCVADHGGDALRLEAWLENKRADEVRRWLSLKDVFVLVAERAGAIVAVGALRRPDTILLNYVAPEARFDGFSRALMSALETELRAGGARMARLTSTRTAERFYRDLGYAPEGRSAVLGVSGLDMAKALTPVDVRRVEDADFVALSVTAAAAYAHAYAALWSDPSRLAERLQRFTPAALSAWSREPGMRLWVAAEAGRPPVGFLGLRLRSPDPVSGDIRAAELHRVYLLPNASGRGIGHALLARAESEARAQEAPFLWLKSMADSPARAAYARWGFREIGEDRLDNDIPHRSAMVVLRKEIAA